VRNSSAKTLISSSKVYQTCCNIAIDSMKWKIWRQRDSEVLH